MQYLQHVVALNEAFGFGEGVSLFATWEIEGMLGKVQIRHYNCNKITKIKPKW